MIGHPVCSRFDLSPNPQELLTKLALVYCIDPLIVGDRDDTLAEIYREPARFEEQALTVLGNSTASGEEIDLLAQTGRNIHGAHVIPEIRIVSLGRVIVQYQEVTDTQKFVVENSIEFFSLELAVLRRREEFDQVGDRGLDQIDRR